MKKLIALVLLFLAGTVYAEPTKFLVGFGPGGTNNIIRILVSDAEKAGLERSWIENRPGANGAVALRSYFQEPPSAFNYLGVSGGQVLYEPLVNPENNFLSELRIIGPVITSPMAIAAGKNSPIKRMSDLFDRRVPAKRINVAVAGEAHQMFLNIVARHSHHDIQAVRFKGSSDGYTALVGGHVDLQVDVIGFFKPYETEINLVAVGGRSVGGVPSILTLVPQAEMNNFFAIAVNKRVTDTQRVEQFLTKGLVIAKQQARLESQGYQVDWNERSDYMSRVVIPAFESWKRIVK